MSVSYANYSGYGNRVYDSTNNLFFDLATNLPNYTSSGQNHSFLYYYWFNNFGSSYFCGKDGNENGSILFTVDFNIMAGPYDESRILSFYDDDVTYTSNPEVYYINTSGGISSGSSSKLKQSLRQKTKNDYLSRLMNLKMYSYLYDKNWVKPKTEKAKKRILLKNLTVHQGFTYENLEENFPHVCTHSNKHCELTEEILNTMKNKYDMNEEEVRKYHKEIKEKWYKNITEYDKKIDVQKLIPYMILSVQQFYQEYQLQSNQQQNSLDVLREQNIKLQQENFDIKQKIQQQEKTLDSFNSQLNFFDDQFNSSPTRNNNTIIKEQQTKLLQQQKKIESLEIQIDKIIELLKTKK